ncbi:MULTISPECIES: hypothetical protein [unclassified Streptomyces]|uniref:hypothetical protein n=1 Tax=unclassified Streptomyces TaxID=2593676 RepID=UPI00380EDD01
MISLVPCHEFRHQAAVTASARVVVASEKTFQGIDVTENASETSSGTILGIGRSAAGL